MGYNAVFMAAVTPGSTSLSPPLSSRALRAEMPVPVAACHVCRERLWGWGLWVGVGGMVLPQALPPTDGIALETIAGSATQQNQSGGGGERSGALSFWIWALASYLFVHLHQRAGQLVGFAGVGPGRLAAQAVLQHGLQVRRVDDLQLLPLWVTGQHKRPRKPQDLEREGERDSEVALCVIVYALCVIPLGCLVCYKK